MFTFFDNLLERARTSLLQERVDRNSIKLQMVIGILAIVASSFLFLVVGNLLVWLASLSLGITLFLSAVVDLSGHNLSKLLIWLRFATVVFFFAFVILALLSLL